MGCEGSSHGTQDDTEGTWGGTQGHGTGHGTQDDMEGTWGGTQGHGAVHRDMGPTILFHKARLKVCPIAPCNVYIKTS